MKSPVFRAAGFMPAVDLWSRKNRRGEPGGSCHLLRHRPMGQTSGQCRFQHQHGQHGDDQPAPQFLPILQFYQSQLPLALCQLLLRRLRPQAGAAAFQLFHGERRRAAFVRIQVHGQRNLAAAERQAIDAGPIGGVKRRSSRRPAPACGRRGRSSAAGRSRPRAAARSARRRCAAPARSPPAGRSQQAADQRHELGREGQLAVGRMPAAGGDQQSPFADRLLEEKGIAVVEAGQHADGRALRAGVTRRCFQKRILVKSANRGSANGANSG